MALTKVVTNAITDDAVTAAKIADGTIVAADLAANSVDSSELVDGGVDLSHMSVNSIDSTQYVDGSIDAAHYAAGSVDTTALGADAVTAAKIADDVVNSEHLAAGGIDNEHIADDAIDSEHYADGSIDNAHIADDAIDSEHYADGSIDNAHIADDAIDSEHYAAGSIDTAHIADNQVTLAKMDGLARGKIIYGNASGDPTALAVGSANQLLQHDGTDLSWATVSSGTAWQAIATGATTMVSGRGYFVNTTSSAFTMTLPASPSIGDFIHIIDYAATFDTNNCTVGRNSQKILGASSDLVVATERAAFQLVFVDATQGWLLTEK